MLVCWARAAFIKQHALTLADVLGVQSDKLITMLTA